MLQGSSSMAILPACICKQRIPDNIWNSYFKFSVERNPWDKSISHYYWLQHQRNTEFSFHEYIKRSACINYPIYTDPSKGNIIVDKVLKYEQLTDDLSTVFEKLGIPFDGVLGSKAKSQYRKDRRPYREVFSEDEMKPYVDTIAQRYKREIELHGYDF